MRQKYELNNRLYTILALCLIAAQLSGCVAHAPRPVVAPPGVYHIVGSGQTLYRIAITYGVDLTEIIRANKIKDDNLIGVGQRLFIPGARTVLFVEPYQPQALGRVEEIVGRKQKRINWRYITLHHSATREGNAEIFDRYHRRQRMGGLFYHFVIGNGRGSRDGEIEVGWRWRGQVEVERRADIQICLVGDFNRQELTPAQFNSLVELIEVLRWQYHIPLGNIRRHKDLAGKVTACPGERFPFYRLITELRKRAE